MALSRLTSSFLFLCVKLLKHWPRLVVFHFRVPLEVIKANQNLDFRKVLRTLFQDVVQEASLAPSALGFEKKFQRVDLRQD